jgi:hypothetical protein
MEIEVESLGMLVAGLADFIDDGVFHHSPPMRSSGAQMTGQAYPCFSTTSVMECLILACESCEPDFRE